MGKDDVSIAIGQSAHDAVSEFADVAGPVIMHHLAQGAAADVGNITLFSRLGQSFLEEGHGHIRNIPFMIPERGSFDGDDGKAEIKVFPESATVHFLLQIRIGGGYDACVEFDEFIAAKRVDAAVGKSPQKGLLHAEGGIADFVQHERPAFGSQKGSFAGLLRFCVCAFDVTEKGIHEQSLVESAAVDCNEGAILPF